MQRICGQILGFELQNAAILIMEQVENHAVGSQSNKSSMENIYD